MRRFIPLLALLTSCLAVTPTTQFIPTNASPVPLRPKSGTEVPVVSTPPTRPFVELGLIEGRRMTWNDEPNIIWSMRSSAGALGCDVLLLTGALSDNRGIAGYHGACLVYSDAPPPSQAAPGPLAAIRTVAPPPPPPPAPKGLLFRNREGNLFRVQPEGRSEALRMGWVEVKEAE
jgi:hypothetical protein